MTNKQQKNPNKKPCLWIHCASLGEFEQGRTIIEALKKQNPNIYIWLTFFSPSGYEIRKNFPLADTITYLPLDTPANARDFLQIVQPNFVIFVKYEHWYFYLQALKKQAIPTYLISAFFRPQQIFFKPQGFFFREILSLYKHIFVQNQASKKLLEQIELHNVTITGDTRFDRVCQNAQQTTIHLHHIAAFKKHRTLIVAGSTWQKDEELLAKIIDNSYLNNFCWIIAPHETHQANLKRIETIFQKTKKTIIRYSKIASLPPPNSASTEPNILLIDNIGMLSSIYQYANYAYIGGGFGKGIHNILEPAVFGMPVYFGTNYRKFQEANELIALNGAFSVKNSSELLSLLQKHQKNTPEYENICQTSKKYVSDGKGATEKIIQHILPKN